MYFPNLLNDYFSFLVFNPFPLSLGEPEIRETEPGFGTGQSTKGREE